MLDLWSSKSAACLHSDETPEIHRNLSVLISLLHVHLPLCLSTRNKLIDAKFVCLFVCFGFELVNMSEPGEVLQREQRDSTKKKKREKRSGKKKKEKREEEEEQQVREEEEQR